MAPVRTPGGRVRRSGRLWPELTSWENLCLALRRAAAGKRSRADVAGFLLYREPRLVELQRELVSGTYEPGGYRTFEIVDPKPRTISAAPFRDRVVHHAITQVLEPVFEPRFARQSYACRVGFGTHRAIEAAHLACGAFPYVLQCDVRKYFPSIDHAILQEQLERAVKCLPTLALAGKIIDGAGSGAGDRRRDPVYFPGDDLFSALDRPRGLPLGNQTSQFFANVYLNDLDQFVLREIRPRVYCRYVDDFLLFHEDKGFLSQARAMVEARLEGLRLRLHDGKSRIHRTTDGITFLGFRLFPDHMRLARGNVVRFRRRLRKLQLDYADGLADWPEVRASLQAWNAHAEHGDTWRLREEVFGGAGFSRDRGDPGRASQIATTGPGSRFVFDAGF